MRILLSNLVRGGALLCLLLAVTTDAWTTSNHRHRLASGAPRTIQSPLQMQQHAISEPKESSLISVQHQPLISRRNALASAAALTAATAVLFQPQPASALVKGVAPPPPRSKASAGGGSGGGSDKPKCTNVEECQASAEVREAQLRAEEEAGPPPMVTKGGVKYRDVEGIVGQADGGDSSATAEVVRMGDEVNLYFKVLKLGKRSYDGLSGEGTVVFSRGYGLEDDEDKPGIKSFSTIVGNTSNIAALNEALVGMKLQGIRRFSIAPQKGWEKATAACDGGPGGRGAGGDLRTDYVVVPTAQLVEQESCFDKNKQPFPSTYAQQRRMAQRFDQSLIMEVQVVRINNDSKMALQL